MTPKPVKTATQKNEPLHSAANDIFAKIKTKTGMSDEKIEAWQKDWLAMPQTRKKYEHLQDAPQVILEEGLAMANDIVDFIQKQPGGQSAVFGKIKGEIGAMMKDPAHFFQGQFSKAQETVKSWLGKGKAMAQKAQGLKEQAQAGANQVKKAANKTKTGKK